MILAFDSIENKQDVYGGDDFMKKFCEILSSRSRNEDNIFEKKKMVPLTNDQQESCEKSKTCHTCKNMFEYKHTNHKNYLNVKDHCSCSGKYRGATHSICDLKYSIPKEIPLVFLNGSNYDYHKRDRKRV